MEDFCSRKARLFSAAILASGLLLLGVLAPQAAHAATCNTFISFDYPTAPPPPGVNSVGETLRVSLTLGSGMIGGGSEVALNRVRFELDCNADSALGLGCTDDGNAIEYQGDGTILTDCSGEGGAVTFSTGHPTSPSPNQVVFTPSEAIVIPAGNQNFCFISFEIKILAASGDTLSPQKIEQVAGFSAIGDDAECDNGLASSGSQSGSIPLCPPCNEGDPNTDGDFCTPPMCNAQVGTCSGGGNDGGECSGDLDCDGGSCEPTGRCFDGDPKVCAENDPGTEGNFCNRPSW
jgi:hypothetical protein